MTTSGETVTGRRTGAATGPWAGAEAGPGAGTGAGTRIGAGAGAGAATGAVAAVPGRAGRWRVCPPGALPTVAAAVAAGLSTMTLWWAVPAAVAAFLAGRRSGRTAPTALALVAVVAAGVVALTVVPAWLPLASRFVAVVVAAVMLPWFAGRFWRQYRQLVRAGWERAEHLQREQQLIAEQTRLRERARIARDMHDVLGHDLSLIALSAGALKLAPGLEVEHRRAASEIRARAAAAVERLGEVVGVLHDGPDGPDGAGGAPVDRDRTGLAGLVAEASAAGLAVELRVDGTEDGLPPAVERAAHRVVQEALTNVAKHAPGAAATVDVTHTDAGTTVVVENGPSAVGESPAPDGRGPGSRSGGRGLVGLEERVRLTGGWFDHGPRDGGYAVVARIPHAPPPPSLTAAASTTTASSVTAAAATGTLPPPPQALGAPEGARPRSALPQEHHRIRRRTRRTLVAAVMVPLVTGALLSGALVVWEMHATAQSVLDPRDLARLHVGQERSEVGRLLPDRQTDDHPRAAEPPGDGVTCEYYAVTANRFDDRSGDAYRLCFREDVLVSVTTLTG